MLYGEAFKEARLRDAYERLVLDALHGDALLFMREDEIDAAWRVVDPLLAYWRSDPPTSPTTPPARGDPTPPTNSSPATEESGSALTRPPLFTAGRARLPAVVRSAGTRRRLIASFACCRTSRSTCRTSTPVLPAQGRLRARFNAVAIPRPRDDVEATPVYVVFGGLVIQPLQRTSFQRDNSPSAHTVRRR
jgi:hypothetical protein